KKFICSRIRVNSCNSRKGLFPFPICVHLRPSAVNKFRFAAIPNPSASALSCPPCDRIRPNPTKSELKCKRISENSCNSRKSLFPCPSPIRVHPCPSVVKQPFSNPQRTENQCNPSSPNLIQQRIPIPIPHLTTPTRLAEVRRRQNLK